MKSPRTIALCTDFGHDDAYIASMKRVILTIAPSVQIVDISHSIKPQNITQASYLLWSVYKYFPKGTIFITIVDPGVSGKRKNICSKGNGYIFLAPDNGILQYVANEVQFSMVVNVTNEKYFSPTISRTFHGRDIFAPVAAHISNGVPLNKIGLCINNKLHSERFVSIGTKSGTYKGKILHIDHFGNIITDFLSPRCLRFCVNIGKRIVHECSRTYESAPPKIPFFIEGSSGLLEISIKSGNAATALHASLNQSLELIVP
jgi:S-adenosyl-L-methionine hydrolase (adenosine-forming)